MKINHVALFTNQLEEMKLFYVTYFNGKSNQLYQNKLKGFRSYFISFEDNARLELMARDNVTEKQSLQDHLGYIHLAFSVGSKDKVDELTNTLKKDGYTVLSGPRVTVDGYYESCILDPDRNQVEIVV